MGDHPHRSTGEAAPAVG
jgi:putative transposase